MPFASARGASRRTSAVRNASARAREAAAPSRCAMASMPSQEEPVYTSNVIGADVTHPSTAPPLTAVVGARLSRSARTAAGS